MYIGRLFKENKKHYFLKMATLDLCKCYVHEFSELITKATEKNNSSNYKEVYWSYPFEVNQEQVVKDMKNNEHYLFKEWGEEKTKDVVRGLADIFESWESKITEDNYGCNLRAIPIQEVYEAMLASQEKCEHGYYSRFTIGLAMLKGFLENFEEIYVVLFGY
jgi:hypothetical protein